MVFSSHLFLFYFLPLALGVYYVLPRGGRHLALTLLSYLFYGWADPRFLLLLIGTTVVDYVAALAIGRTAPWSRAPIEALPVGGGRSGVQRGAIVLSILSNLCVLACFKYFNFSVGSYGQVAGVLFDTAGIGAVDAWYGAVAYSFQIYFDFSGYSDMAVGLGLMMGFMFAKNFDSPYRAESITEFWRRWHLSLSTWLRDYLYVPLGGNRLGERRTYLNIAIVMLLGGLWHGAAWTFVALGGVPGGAVIGGPGG